MSFKTEKVDFETQDGLTLRGDLTLPGRPNAPVVILLLGVSNILPEMSISHITLAFY